MCQTGSVHVVCVCVHVVHVCVHSMACLYNYVYMYVCIHPRVSSRKFLLGGGGEAVRKKGGGGGGEAAILHLEIFLFPIEMTTTVLDETLHTFVIYICIHVYTPLQVHHFQRYWSNGKVKGFEVYIVELNQMENIDVCVERNVHKRTRAEIEKASNNTGLVYTCKAIDCYINIHVHNMYMYVC